MSSKREFSVALRIPIQSAKEEDTGSDSLPKNGLGGKIPRKVRLPLSSSSHTRLRSLICAIVLLGVLQLWVSNSSLQHDEGILDAHLNQLRLQLHTPPRLRTLPVSTWTCTYEGDSSLKARKSRQCIVTNACVDDKGLFLLSHKQQQQQDRGQGVKDRDHDQNSGGIPDHHGSNSPLPMDTFPEVNLMSSRESADYFWRPRFKPMGDDSVRMHYKDETIFVYGLFQPGHFSHFLYDGMLPLFSTMKRFGGKTSSWLLRQAEYLGENSVDQAVWEVEAIISEGRELVLHSFEVVNASFQALPPKDAPICFARAVIGLGSQCGLNYCANSIPTEVYQEYSRRIKEYYWPNPERWRLHMILRAEQERIRGDQEQHHLDRSLVFSPTKCIHSAQYYNFDPEFSTTPRSEEPQERQARGQPDDAQTDPRKRSLPIVAILKREGTRSVINLDRVISVIAETGHFRLKVISYDHGCGIPETAYLMRDVQILISPHGNALGSSLWMPSTEPSNSSLSYFPTVISIDSTKYTESWFQWTTTSMGQRFMVHRCGPAHSTHPFKSEMNPAVCPFHRDMDLARRTLSKAGLVLNPEKKDDDLLELTGEEFPIDLWEKYGGENVNKFLNEYWKSLSRYADPDRLLEILYKIREYNLPRQEIDEGVSEKKMSFLQLCRESKCCAPSCSGVMHRNVVGPLRAYDQDLSEDNWGRLRDNEEHDAFVMSGLALMDWFPSLT